MNIKIITALQGTRHVEAEQQVTKLKITMQHHETCNTSKAKKSSAAPLSQSKRLSIQTPQLLKATAALQESKCPEVSCGWAPRPDRVKRTSQSLNEPVTLNATQVQLVLVTCHKLSTTPTKYYRHTKPVTNGRKH